MSKFQWSLTIFVLIEGSIYFQFQGHSLQLLLLAILAIVYFSLLFFFSMNLSFNFFIEALTKGEAQSVALTFDDGPHPELTPKLLDILDRYEAKAAFFIIGEKAKQYPEIVKEIVKRGHLIGGHSHSHPLSFGILSRKNVEKEIMDGIHLVKKIAGVETDLFRPPFGVTNPRVAKVVTKNRLKVIGWNLRSYDTASKDAKRLLSRLKKKLNGGSIILLHDTMPGSIEIMPDLLQHIGDKNLKVSPDFE